MATPVTLALPDRAPKPRALALSHWLLCVAALVFLMVVIGGITRLTESGLSITRWEPISGAIPPIGQDAWQTAFDSYRQSPQYQAINRGMTLSEFKDIYFWEYVHRLIGRLIGLAFALPLAWFAWRRAIPAGYGWRLTGLLALGALQGAVGWWMVASGLVDRPDVSHIRLAVHLLLALLILAALVWTALDLRTLARQGEGAGNARMPTLAIWTLSALALQMMFGAYVAGLDAGYAYDSWPMMSGEFFPSGTPMLEPFLRNFVDNGIVVQFVHRWLAWGVAALVTLLAWQAWKRGHYFHSMAVVSAVAFQIVLGILTLLSGVELWIAVSHQGMAALLLASIVATAHRIGGADSVTGIVSVYATFADVEEARRIGRMVVEEGLAACVNVLGTCHSIYRWQGAVEEADEVAAIFKTAAARSEALVERIGELHSYAVPAAVIWPIAGGLEAYRDWVLAECKGGPEIER